MTEPVRTFRDAIRAIIPTWLQRKNGYGILYSIAVHIDALADAVTNGVKLRFPGVYSNEYLPMSGRDRRIRRGRTETDAVYAARMTRWLDDHSTRGGPYAMLAQLHAHFAPNNFPIQLVYFSGRRFSMDVDGNVTVDDIEWTPDADTAKWARWWLFYEWPVTVPPARKWGDGSWGDARVWGSGLTVQEVTDLRLVPKEWNAAHCFGRVVLLSDGARLWGYPPRAWGDGVWGESVPVSLSIG